MSSKQKIITKNWKVVVLSFIVAATFWFFKALNKNNYSATIDYPVTFIYESDSLIATKPLPEHIKLDVSGGGWNLLNKSVTLSADPIKIRLSNPTEIKSITRVSLLPQVVDQLKSINVKQIITDTLHISIEKLITKKVKLLLDTSSYTIEKGYTQIGDPIISPDSVVLTGPKSFINEVSAQLLAFDNDEFDNNIDKSIDIETINDELVTSNLENANVQLTIDKLVRKEFSLPIQVKYFDAATNNSNGFSLSDTTVNISFDVPITMEDIVTENEFEVYVAVRNSNNIDSVLTVELKSTPSFISSLQIVPNFVKVLKSER